MMGCCEWFTQESRWYITCRRYLGLLTQNKLDVGVLILITTSTWPSNNTSLVLTLVKLYAVVLVIHDEMSITTFITASYTLKMCVAHTWSYHVNTHIVCGLLSITTSITLINCVWPNIVDLFVWTKLVFFTKINSKITWINLDVSPYPCLLVLLGPFGPRSL